MKKYVIYTTLFLAALAAWNCGDINPSSPSATGKCQTGNCVAGSTVSILD